MAKNELKGLKRDKEGKAFFETEGGDVPIEIEGLGNLGDAIKGAPKDLQDMFSNLFKEK